MRRSFPWVRIASSVQSWAEDPLEARYGFRAVCAQLQAIITQRKLGDSWSV